MVKRHLAGLIVAAAVAGGGVAAAAAPGAGPARPQAQAQRQDRGRPGPDGALLRHAVHGDLIVRSKDGMFETVNLDKGVVESKGASSVTLKRADGKTVTLTVNPDTKYRGVDSLAALETGKPAVAVSHDGTARMIGQRAPGRNNPNSGNVGADEQQVPAT